MEPGEGKGKPAEPVGDPNAARMKGITVVKAIVYGNQARYFGKKRDEDGHTHQWTIYLKPYKNEDMSVYVRKVHFKLHDSYTNQNRIITKPPYEVTETGWGEFEIVIKIYFNDINERPLTIYHFLKLFHTETDIMLGKKNLISESYDEMVFHEPTPALHQLLQISRPLTVGVHKHETDFDAKKERTLQNILTAKKKIAIEIQELNERLKQTREAIQNFKDEIGKLEHKERTHHVTAALSSA